MKLANANMASTAGKLSLIALAILAAQGTWADESKWYAGANVGQARATVDDMRISAGLANGGLTMTGINDEERDRGYKIFGGYQLNRNLAIEAGYFDLGQFSFMANTVPTGTLSGNIRVRGLNLDLVGTLPVTEKFSVLGRIGINHAESRDSFTGTGAVNVLRPNPSERDTNLKVGLGLQYAFSDSLAARLEMERYRINDAVGNKGDVDLVSLGLVYRFGAKAAAPVPRATAPVPVVMTPDPQPVIVMAAPAPPPPPPPMPAKPMAPTRVSFSADSLFDFDKSIVKPEGKQELDKFAADLRGVNYNTVSVIGHTDRIGSHDYNLKLSTRRAEAVQSYLVQTAGIPAAKISARGVNGSDPVTKPGDCVGNKATKALIACLQPDRRVDIEVVGTR